jgi:hypothetical protein
LKTKIVFLGMIAMIYAIDSACPQTSPAPRGSRAATSIPKYTCVMHPEVVSDKPGKCPKCGMELVPKSDPRKKETHGIDAHHLSGMGTQSAPQESVHREREHSALMKSSVDLVDPMSREGSGTSWLPDSSPMYGRMFMFGEDILMLHGVAFARYTNVSTRRGDDRIDAPNWIMAMYSHPLGDNAQLGARLMMSLDPLTEGGRGYPLLFQSGESWHNQPLHDRQHPHDLFSELSLSYSQKFTDDMSAFVYFGYPGEPALGPPTFMHRISALDDPDAPLGHHWQDSTHVTFGVATAGVVWRTLKIEGSVFTGREPDENRYDFDRPRFDSASGRISWNPIPNLALQFSHGYLKSPEALEPNANQHRTTSSLIYNVPLGPDSNWATTFVWGQNNTAGEGKTQSFLLESDFQRGRDTFYTRLERVEKSGHELVLSGADLQRVFPIFAASLGYVRDLTHGNGLDFGLGAQFTIDHRPSDLNRYYGDELGYGFQVFLRIRPSLHSRSEMDHDRM